MKSEVAERVLRNEVKAVLEIQKAKVAGEVILQVICDNIMKAN